MASNQRLTETGREQVKRRGLMAGLIALAAGLLGKTTERVAEATHGGGIDPTALHVSQNNTTSGGPTVLIRTAAAKDRAFQINNNNGIAIYGFTSSPGDVAIFAESQNGDGVQVVASNVGVNAGSSTNVGVRGESTAFHGVAGVGGSIGAGVFGQHTGGTAVWGQSVSGQGVLGFSTNNRGVQGQSTNNIGTYAFSANNIGLWAESPSNIAVNAVSSSGTAVRGDAPGGTAGAFIGPVFMSSNLNVNGNLVVLGTKSAAVPDTGGNYRLLFCLEAPESWFQDFGEARLVNGRAEVPLSPDFAAAVHTNQYLVFLTEYGESNNGLYVARRDPTGFEVRAAYDKGPTSFGYVIVAKRKDVAPARMPLVSRNRLTPPPAPPETDRPRPAMPFPPLPRQRPT